MAHNLVQRAEDVMSAFVLKYTLCPLSPVCEYLRRQRRQIVACR